jgi:hypothetical protein
MLTKEQKIEIDRLSEEGLNVSEIAKQMKLDWKTVKSCISQRSQENMGVPSKNNNQLDENELTKVIFQKFNAGIPPGKIVEGVGHVNLVTSLYQKWKGLRGLHKPNSSLPNPQMLTDYNTWDNSFEKYPDWHFGRAIRVIGEVGYQRMISCPDYKNRDIECYQIENNDPYMCLACPWFSDKDDL